MSKTNIYYVTFKGVTRNAKGQSFASIEDTIVYAENIEDVIKTLKDFGIMQKVILFGQNQ